MDVTFTDSSWEDLGVLPVVSSDWAYGSSENDFELVLSSDVIPDFNSLVYVEGTEIGGMVRGAQASSDSDSVRIYGDTWTGVMDSKVIGPDSGSDYLVLSGDVRDIVETLVSRAGLDDLFTVKAYKPGVTTTHTFKGTRSDASQQDAGRYMTCWAAIWQLLVENECKLMLSWDASSRKVIVTVDKASDLTDDEFQGVCTVTVKKTLPVNHLVCLGSGELSERSVEHVYLDSDGNASTTQTLTGYAEIADVYEDVRAAGDELISDGKSKLRSLASEAESVEVYAPSTIQIDLGDIVGGISLGVDATAVVSKRVVRTSKDAVSYDYTTTVR
jgi:hypothetical protein